MQDHALRCPCLQQHNTRRIDELHSSQFQHQTFGLPEMAFALGGQQRYVPFCQPALEFQHYFLSGPRCCRNPYHHHLQMLRLQLSSSYIEYRANINSHLSAKAQMAVYMDLR